MHSQYLGRATNALVAACSDDGILASAAPLDNYCRVWARDAVVGGLAILSLEDAQDTLTGAFRRSLLTLARFQHPLGQIPSNVYRDAGQYKVSYGGLCGRVDASAWFVLGSACYMRRYAADTAFQEQIRPHIERALAVMEAWEFNGRDLMYVPQGANWADEYLIEGYTLYDNLLRMRALELLAETYQKPKWADKGAAIRRRLTQNYWLGANRPEADYHPAAYLQAAERPFWAATFAPGGYAQFFDLWANSLAVCFGLGEELQRGRVCEHLVALLQEYQGLAPAFSPVIQPGDPQWPMLAQYYAYRFKNYPHHFHNGGIWPVVLGFACQAFAAAGYRQYAAALCQTLETRLEEDQWRFREYLSSNRFEWGGAESLTYTASGYLLALRSVESNKPPFW